MYEEDKAKSEERERYVKELVMEYSRIELDEVAVGLGLDPEDYPNKRAMAEAILEAREREEAPVEEAPPEYPPMEEVTEEVEKVSTNTVRDIIRGIDKQTDEFKAFTSALQQNAQEWLQKSVAAFHQSVKEQDKKNKDFARKINEGIIAFHQSVKMFQQCIQEQIKDNRNFVKRFYG